MQPGLRIGVLFGIPLYIHPSWFYIFVMLTWVYGPRYASLHRDSGFLGVLAGLLMVIGLFSSVLIHELGHSLVARSFGIKVSSITLFLFGGVAAIEQEPKTPGQTFQIAIAGPTVSLLIAGVLILMNRFNSHRIIGDVGDTLGGINLTLGLFNLIPGLPLDGGQMLKAIVWKLTGDRFKGIYWAATLGLLLGWFAIILGVWTALLGGFQGLWMTLLGWFVVQNASTTKRFAHIQHALVAIKAGDAMGREFRVLDANLTLRQFVDDYVFSESRYPIYFTASKGRYVGMISIESLRSIERSQWESKTLHDISQPLTEIDCVTEKTSLLLVINQIEVKSLRRITVLSPTGGVAGVIDRGDMVRAVAGRLKSRLSESDVRRIKEEGTYPPDLPLSAIAKAYSDLS